MTTFEFNRDEMIEAISIIYYRYPDDKDIENLFDIILGSRVQIDADEVLLTKDKI